MKRTQSDGITLLLFLCAVFLSATAAFYAVSGLVAIFAAAAIPIIVMGSMLEVSKLVLASWLYRNWKETTLLLRTYFVIALAILMALTSMGIFGYLSKAHLDQGVPSGDVAAKVALLDEQIKTEKENVESAKRQLRVLDTQVEQAIGRSDSTQGVERSVQIRRGQQKERSSLLAEIGQSQTRISRLNEERAPIATELRKVEAEVGPLKYVAALLYGDNLDANVLEKAVRFVIIMIVCVFDPLAVLMLIAVNQSSMRKQHGTKQETKEPAEETIDTKVEVSSASQENPTSFTYTVPDEAKGSSYITISTPTQPEEPEQEQLDLDFESGSESGSSEQQTDNLHVLQPEPMPVQLGSTETEPVAEVPESVQVIEPLPVPLGPLAQKLYPDEHGTDVKEVLEKPTSGRPPRLQ